MLQYLFWTAAKKMMMIIIIIIKVIGAVHLEHCTNIAHVFRSLIKS